MLTALKYGIRYHIIKGAENKEVIQ